MKSTVAAVGLMATLASASAHQPRHFHWRRDNSTASAQPGYTTLTVEVTEVATITSCAPTITNCPARSASLSASDLHTYVVTNVVHLTETVCPVSEAESISKSLVQEHSTGSLPGVTRTAPAVTTPTGPAGVPLTTGGAPPAAGVPSQTNSAQDPTITSPPAGDDEDEDDDCPADGEVETTVTQIVTTKTLTMTVGKGSTASVVTTAVPTTIESTVLVTKPATDGAVKPSASVPASGSVTGAVGSEEPTTTTTATSTGTRTVTIKRPAASGTPGSGSGSDNADAECSCPAQVTVTVPASTVYVTIGGASATPSAPVNGAGSGNNGGAAEPSKTASASAPTTTETADDGEDDGDDECPADEEEVVTLSTTVTVAPFPTNGTAPGAGSAKPTGAPAYRRSNKLF
ncbi:extracellular serine-threonine rich protein [Colletotrichum kahawae]|uniref:Extracellular serine-threonine rich protein n=1 Tax=Colletotrichum kahawae TaxID=34407 RepID=A0AAE0D577_COLKA|nr:extracellular serine-threonine rich protein [Colletotrichum kahawae]